MSAAEPNRKRRAYWIADEITQTLKDRAQLLADKGLDVRFFTTLELLLKELEIRRAAIIVISDDGPESTTERILMTLMTMSEIQGARLVMVRSRRSEWLNFLAACGNVRDIIPAALADGPWLARFLFATAARAVPFVQPAGQITFNNISAVQVPARLTWIGAHRLRLETRLRPPVGASLTLGGPLADSLGVSNIQLTVRSVERHRLLYRFSDAIVADWRVLDQDKPRAEVALKELRAHNTGPRCRVFVAIQSLGVRAQVLERFDDPRFEVSTALQKQSFVDEPRFFTPDLVIIEDKLVSAEGQGIFAQMLDNLTPETTVVVLGKVPELAEVIKRHPRRRIAELTSIPKNLPQSALARYARDPEAEGDQNVAHILPDHPYSLAEISVPARLTRIHPLAAQIATPFPIGTFALCRLESPVIRKILDRNPYIKITAAYQDTHPQSESFVHLADCYLADVDQEERGAMAQGLTRLVAESLVRLDPAGGIGAKVSRGESRTPELGSVKRGELGFTIPAAISLPPPPKTRDQAVALSQTPATDGNGALKLEPAVEPLTPKEEALIPTREIAELLKPAFAEVAGEIGREVMVAGTGMARGLKRTVKKDSVINTITAAIVIGTVLLLMIILYRVLSPDWDKSGTVYSDQLKKFAPHVNRPTDP